ncbi:MAG: hypothetical protein LBT05_07635 [Planctomycetaceae bacterium]|nr:hypothetical protein [Planctomycetaceae bacterium]
MKKALAKRIGDPVEKESKPGDGVPPIWKITRVKCGNDATATPTPGAFPSQDK